MKKSKRIISALLSVLMLSLMMIMPVNAGTDLPESKHDYENNSYEQWHYEYKGNAKGLYLTFSGKTTFSEGGYFCDAHPDGCIYDDMMDEYYEDPCDENSKFHTISDMLYIVFDNNYEFAFTGDELSGRTIYIPRTSFDIILYSDDYSTDYGFKITRIAPTLPDYETAYRYNFGDGSHYIEVGYGDNYLNWELRNYIVDGEAIIGWKTEDGEQYFYEWNDGLPDRSGMIDLYPITTPVALLPEDVYGFTNSERYMLVNGEDRHFFTPEHKARLHESLEVAAAGSYLKLPAAILSLVFKDYDQWDWAGSCIGFANTVCLQKKGILDVVSTQEDAECMRDLVPDAELISLINYYNAHSAASLITKNKGLIPGTKDYTRQIKNLVESVREGNLVLFEFYPYALENNFNYYHGIVFTGAYTLPDGRHVLLYYDENYDGYAYGFPESTIVAADYSSIEGYEDAMFFWTDEFECYKSLDVNGDYDDGTYFKDAFEAHIAETVSFWLEEYIKPFLAKLFGSAEE